MRTPYADVDALLDQLLRGLTAGLGGRLLGVYLFGSVATGDYDADVSDVDLLAVLESELSPAEFAALESHYAEVSRGMPEWRDRIEVLHVSREALRTFRDHPSQIAVITPGERLNVRPAGIRWLMNWWMVREHGQVLIGPPASEFIAPITSEEFVDVIRGYAREVYGRLDKSDTRRSQAYLVLTLCRAIYTCEHGPTVSKPAAAEWAIGAFPQWEPLIRDALEARAAWRDEERATGESTARTAAFLEFALGQLS